MLVTENDYPLRWLISAWERGLKLEGLINLSTKCRGSLDRAVRAELCLADSQGQWDECLPPHSLQPWTLISCTPCTWSRAGLSLLLLRQQTLVVLIRNIPSPLSQTSIWATWKYKVSITSTISPLSETQGLLQRNTAAMQPHLETAAERASHKPSLA